MRAAKDSPPERGVEAVDRALSLLAAFRDGDGQFGVTWHRMDAQLDTGAILLQEKIAINDDDTAQTLVGSTPMTWSSATVVLAAQPSNCSRRAPVIRKLSLHPAFCHSSAAAAS